jgi:hypothetical protein
MNIELVKPYLDLLSGVANAFTIAASFLAIYIYVTSHEKISTALKLLLNYSFQTTLSELKEKLERLNEYNAKEPEHIAEIQSILHEIAGQIKGNSRLLACAPGLPERIERLAGSKKITEPLKRSLVSEVREILRNIQVNSMEGRL